MSPESRNEFNDPKISVKELWLEHGGKGKCPPTESPVMRRLVSLCKEYIKIFLQQRQLANKPLSSTSDGENYFAKNQREVVRDVVSNSDILRRKLHNDIAEILTGKTRSSMSEGEANNVADFACRVATGLSIFEI